MTYKDPKITISEQFLIVGKRTSMSLSDNKTSYLWQSFMPYKDKIQNTINNELISLQVYNESMVPGDFDQQFDKWAAVQVSGFDSIPDNMESLIIQSGLYAVFNYKGLPEDHHIYYYIFTEWIPKSSYKIANRPHFEVLGEKYQNGSSNSEEEIWIPIKKLS